MELPEVAQKFFDGVGISSEVVGSLFSEENTDFDVDAAVNNFKTLTKAKLKPEFDNKFQEELTTQFGTARIKFMRDANKTFDLGFTNDEIKELDYKDFLSKAKEGVESKGQGSEEEIQAKYAELSTKYETSVNTMKNDYETKLQKALEDNEKYISKNEFLSAWGSKTLGVDKDQKDFFQNAFYTELTNKYKVLPGRKITNLDGTPVMNPEENGMWSTVDDFLDYNINRLKIGKVSGGSETGSGDQFEEQGGRRNSTKPSPATQAIIDRAKKAGVIVS